MVYVLLHLNNLKELSLNFVLSSECEIFGFVMLTVFVSACMSACMREYLLLCRLDNVYGTRSIVHVSMVTYWES